MISEFRISPCELSVREPEVASLWSRVFMFNSASVQNFIRQIECDFSLAESVNQFPSRYFMETSGGIVNFCFLLAVNTGGLRTGDWGWQINNRRSLNTIRTDFSFCPAVVTSGERGEVGEKETICRVVAGQWCSNTITVYCGLYTDYTPIYYNAVVIWQLQWCSPVTPPSAVVSCVTLLTYND